jgi:hypothetical protein
MFDSGSQEMKVIPAWTHRLGGVRKDAVSTEKE